MSLKIETNLEKSLDELRGGRFAVIVDDIGEQFSAYLMTPASTISSEDVSFMVNQTRGITIVALSHERAGELGLSQMSSPHAILNPEADMLVSVEARQGVTTGISAQDRARTIRLLAKSTNPKFDLVSPGHVFPFRARKGGVLVKSSVWEASIDAMEICGQLPAVAICHILDVEGNIVKENELKKLVESLKLPCFSISNIIERRLQTEAVIEKVSSTQLPCRGSEDYTAHVFKSKIDGVEHFAISKGDLSSDNVLVRVQSDNPLEDIFGIIADNASYDTPRIQKTLEIFKSYNDCVLISIRQKQTKNFKSLLKSLSREDENSRKNFWSIREIGIGSQILRELGISSVSILQGSSSKIPNIKSYGIEIKGAVSLDD